MNIRTLGAGEKIAHAHVVAAGEWGKGGTPIFGPYIGEGYAF